MKVKRIEWINDITYIGIDGISRKTTHYDLHLIPGAVIKPIAIENHFDDGTENGKGNGLLKLKIATM